MEVIVHEFTVKEIAARERVTPQTVRKWISKGLIVEVRPGIVLSPQDEQAIQEIPWTWFSGVYFIRCESFVKIGYAYDVRKRLEGLQTSSPFTLEPLGFIRCESQEQAALLERSLHVRFSKYRRRNEWFVLTREIDACVCVECSLWPSPARKRHMVS
jgi:hypothetical protein